MLCSPTGFDCPRQKWFLSIISQVEDCPITCSGTAILRSDILNSIKMVSRAKLRSVIGDVITGHKIIPLNESFFSVGCFPNSSKANICIFQKVCTASNCQQSGFLHPDCLNSVEDIVIRKIAKSGIGFGKNKTTAKDKLKRFDFCSVSGKGRDLLWKQEKVGVPGLLAQVGILSSEIKLCLRYQHELCRWEGS